MGILQWLGLSTRSGSVESAGGTSPLPGATPPPRSSAAAVTLDTALRLPTVYRSISILATALSQLELQAWRGGQVIASPALIRQPNPNQTLQQTLKRTVIGLAGCGNAFWRVHRSTTGVPFAIEALNPLGMTYETTQLGQRIWHYSDPIHGSLRLTDHDVKHLRLLEVPGAVMGLGPIQAAAQTTIGAAMSLREYADNWFNEGAVPTGVLSTDQFLDQEMATQYRARWEEMQRRRGVAVVGQGLAYDPIMLKPADAQFLETQQFSVTDIARLFGIPAAYLLAEVNGSSMTYQSLEMADTQFLRYTLMQYIGEIESALSALLPYGQTAKLDVSGLLRPDAKTRAEIAKTYVGLGVLTPNEVRNREFGLPSIAGGDRTPSTAPASLQPQESTDGNA